METTEFTQLQEQLERIEKNLLLQKEVLNLEEVARYTGISKSQLYKLTSSKRIPHYCPTGRFLYFNRKEVEEWLQQNRVTPINEIKEDAENYCVRKRMNEQFNM